MLSVLPGKCVFSALLLGATRTTLWSLGLVFLFQHALQRAFVLLLAVECACAARAVRLRDRSHAGVPTPGADVGGASPFGPGVPVRLRTMQRV